MIRLADYGQDRAEHAAQTREVFVVSSKFPDKAVQFSTFGISRTDAAGGVCLVLLGYPSSFGVNILILFFCVFLKKTSLFPYK